MYINLHSLRSRPEHRMQLSLVSALPMQRAVLRTAVASIRAVRRSLLRTVVNQANYNSTPQHLQKKANYTDAACVGPDGAPISGIGVEGEQESRDEEGLEHHKASPLSEIRVSDTRKPIMHSVAGGYEDIVVLYTDEQRDTAEESLLRCAQKFKERASLGDTDFPPSRVLRELRGEL